MRRAVIALTGLMVFGFPASALAGGTNDSANGHGSNVFVEVPFSLGGGTPTTTQADVQFSASSNFNGTDAHGWVTVAFQDGSTVRGSIVCLAVQGPSEPTPDNPAVAEMEGYVTSVRGGPFAFAGQDTIYMTAVDFGPDRDDQPEAAGVTFVSSLLEPRRQPPCTGGNSGATAGKVTIHNAAP
jgi:hypothetical protein